MRFSSLWSIFITSVSVVTASIEKEKTESANLYRPIVIWHGMGDSCCNENSIGGLIEQIEEELPGVFIHSISVTDNDSDLIERKNSYFGNINEQVDNVCQQLKSDPLYSILKPYGFNAVGFSQGSQFLRAYVERCNDPPVYNLISYGGQHNGVSDIPGCLENQNSFCMTMKTLIQASVYSQAIQNGVIQAQYFKSRENYDEYLEKSIFLADINNEREQKNPLYKENMLKLNKFVMIKFAEEDMVIPDSSSWFGWIDDDDVIIPFNETENYKNDWIGLKTLNENEKIDFIEAAGSHMQVSWDQFNDVILHGYLDETINMDDSDDDNSNSESNSDNDDDDSDNNDDGDDDDEDKVDIYQSNFMVLQDHY